MWTASSMKPLYSLNQDYQNEVKHDFFCHGTPLVSVLASCDTSSIVDGTTTFPRSRESKLDAT